MGFKEAIRTVLKEKYASFEGRAARSEYWYFVLFYNLVAVALGFVVGFTGANFETGDVPAAAWIPLIALIIFGLYCFIPNIAVTVRRLHDRNMSGWWLLGMIVLSIIPFVGIIVVIGWLVVMCLKGTDGPNRFGNAPLRPDASADIFS